MKRHNLVSLFVAALAVPLAHASAPLVGAPVVDAANYYGMCCGFQSAVQFTLTSSQFVTTIDVTMYGAAIFKFSLQDSLASPSRVFASSTITTPSEGLNVASINVNATLPSGLYYLAGVRDPASQTYVPGWYFSNGAVVNNAGSVTKGAWSLSPYPGGTWIFTTGITPAFVVNGSAPAALRFVPMTPCRVMETRTLYNFEGRTGAFGPPTLNSLETRTLNLPLSNVCSIPSIARAYAVNVTVVPTNNDLVNVVTVWAAGEPRPNDWTILSAPGQIAANSAIVKAGGDGAINVFASLKTDLLIDISGYYTDSNIVPGLAYFPLTPCRVLDTRSVYRSPSGPFGPPSMAAGETRKFRFPAATPYCSIPAASAYSVTMTVVPPAPLAYVTAWPDGGSQPNVSSINSFAGRVLANSSVIPASADGSIDVFVHDNTDLLIDINGYYAPDNGSGLFYFPVTQCRTSDAGGDPYPDDTARTIPIPTAAGCSGIPSNARAYAINVTALPNNVSVPYISAYPTGQPRPNASILNAFEGQAVTNSAIIPAGTNSAIDIYVYRRTVVVVDVNGYFGR